MINENFHCACIYDIMKDHIHPREKTHTLSHLKSKIVRLHCKRIQSITVVTYESILFQGESPSLFHVLQMRKRQVSWIITSIIYKDVVTQTTLRAFCTPFLRFCNANTI